MSAATIHLTKLQGDELHHKLGIVRDEQDLQDSYETSAEEVEALIQALPVNDAGPFTFDCKHADLLVGEIENACDIARGSDAAPSESRAFIASMRGLIRKVRQVCPEAA